MTVVATAETNSGTPATTAGDPTVVACGDTVACPLDVVVAAEAAAAVPATPGVVVAPDRSKGLTDDNGDTSGAGMFGAPVTSAVVVDGDAAGGAGRPQRARRTYSCIVPVANRAPNAEEEPINSSCGVDKY